MKYNFIKNPFIKIFFSFFLCNVYSQSDTAQKALPLIEHSNKWYDNFSMRGYAQFRYNRLLETNENLTCEQCDKSWGANGGFAARRIRLIFYGQINKQIYFYIQPDFASSPSADRLNFAQIRDAYIDIGLDSDNEFRFRVGQSKVPFGFDNMQSSQNRIALDRSDAMNSGVANERDLGVFFYWANKATRKLFSELVSSGLKGSGDYGIVGLGIYNGQTTNALELNNEPHAVGRITYPFQINKQIIEASIQAYHGLYVIPTANLSKGVKYINNLSYVDQRVAGSFVLYPKPFGIQAEYNVGNGPEFNKKTDSIESKPLSGGYVLINYMAKYNKQNIIPYIRYQFYKGGKKQEKDARSYDVNELEFGIEWQPVKHFELVINYTISQRRFEDFAKKENYQTGNLLRIQAQVNF